MDSDPPVITDQEPPVTADLTCPTLCDPDCAEPCHEVHEVHWKRTHDPAECPGGQDVLGGVGPPDPVVGSSQGLGGAARAPWDGSPLPSGVFGHSKCGAKWRGHRIEHCASCHATFSGTESGDAHRTGEHGVKEGPDRRRCLTADEMVAGGMWATVNAFGTPVWHGRVSKSGVQRRREDFPSDD